MSTSDRPPHQPIPGQPFPLQPGQAYPMAAPQAGNGTQQPQPLRPMPIAPGGNGPPRPMPIQPLQAQPLQARPLPAQPLQPQPLTPGQQATPGNAAPRPLRPQPITPGGVAPTAGARPQPLPAGGAAARPVLVKKGDKPGVTEEPEEEQDAAVVAARAAPPWLISAIVHMVALIVLGLILLPQMINPQVELEVIYAEDIGEQLEDDFLESIEFDDLQVEDPVLSMDMSPVDDPLAAPPMIDITAVDGVTMTSDISAPSIGVALTGREPGMKKALLGAYGGTATTEEAVLLGLKWLRKQQQKDGLWSLSGPYSDGSNTSNTTSATAMALLAFQGAGNTHRTGEFAPQVAKAWEAFRKMQDADGSFYRGGGAHNHRLYSQAQATIAICELYGMTRDPEFKKPAQLAIDYAVKTQSPEGGWRYEPGNDSDTSVTGWFVMALQSGLMAGLEVPSPTLERIMQYLDSASVNGGRQYAYIAGRSEGSPTMTAEGLLCRQYLGWGHDDERLRDGVTLVNANPIDMDDENSYYWYYATQVTHHMGGDYWTKWNNRMREVIPRAQVKSGAEAGSWNPAGDRWGSHGGRLYHTCLQIYMLEVYYRHLPIYKYKMH